MISRASRFKCARAQLLTTEGLLAGTQHAVHPDYEPDPRLQEGEAEASAQQQSLI